MVASEPTTTQTPDDTALLALANMAIASIAVTSAHSPILGAEAVGGIVSGILFTLEFPDAAAVLINALRRANPEPVRAYGEVGLGIGGVFAESLRS